MTDKFSKNCEVGQLYGCADGIGFFEPSDSISILSYIYNVKRACDFNGLYAGAARRLYQHFLMDTAKAALASRIGAIEKGNPYKEGEMTTYSQVVNYLLVTFATNDVRAEAETKITNEKQSEHMSAVKYTDFL